MMNFKSAADADKVPIGRFRWYLWESYFWGICRLMFCAELPISAV